MKRRAMMAVAASLAASLAAPAFASDNWPTKPIRLVVPYPAGGTTDVVARMVSEELGKSLKQPVLVDNKSGANGNIGSAEVARAQPDGYTLLVSGVGSHAINPGLYKMPFDAMGDFVHISQFIAGPNVLVVNNNYAAKNLQDFVAAAKANPDKINYASSGVGSHGHLAMELLKLKAGISVTHIAYRGGAPALADVVAGQIPIMFINQDVAYQYVKTGKLRAIAVASPKRNPLYPDTPTLAEQGFDGVEAVSWVGMSAPKGTPKAIVDRLALEVPKALQSPALKQRLESQGFQVIGSTPSEYTNFIRSETDLLVGVIRKQNITAE